MSAIDETPYVVTSHLIKWPETSSVFANFLRNNKYIISQLIIIIIVYVKRTLIISFILHINSVLSATKSRRLSQKFV